MKRRPSDMKEPNELLILENLPWLKNLARSLVHDEGLADDLVQDTCLTLVKNPPRSDKSLGAWLKRVMLNSLISNHRHEASRRRVEKVIAKVELEQNDPTIVVEQAEILKRVLNHVLALKEPYKSTVLMRFYEEKTASEIALEQGVTAAAVRTRIRTALENLRTSLDRQHGHRSSWSGAFISLSTVEGLKNTSPLGGSGFLKSLSYGGLFVNAGKSISTAVVMSVALLTIGGSSYWLGSRSVSVPPTPITGNALAQEELAQLRSENKALMGKIQEGQDQLSELRNEYSNYKDFIKAREQSAKEKENESDQSEAKSDEGIDWGLLKGKTKNLDSIFSKAMAGEELSGEENLSMQSIVIALAQIGNRGRELYGQPFFDERFLPELFDALYNESLGLDDEQGQFLQESLIAFLEEANENLDFTTASPLERWSKRREIHDQFAKSLKQALSDDQLEMWVNLEKFNKGLFAGNFNENSFGIGNLRFEEGDPTHPHTESVINQNKEAQKRALQKTSEIWKKSFGVDGTFDPVLESYAEKFLNESIDIVSEYIPPEGEQMNSEQQQSMKKQILEAQMILERELMQMLGQEAKERFLDTRPTIINFFSGNGGRTNRRNGSPF